MDSILDTIKKELGLEPDYLHFDTDIVNAINGAFYILWTLGIGPTLPFRIEDNTSVWSDFAGPGLSDLARWDIALRVRLVFDPPSNSALIENIRKSIDEYEFRMMVESENPKLPDYDMSNVYTTLEN